MKLLASILLAAVAACQSHAPMPESSGYPLPVPDQEVPTRISVGDPREGGDWIVYAGSLYDRRYRDGTRNHGSPGKVRGVDKLRYPQTRHTRAVVDYLRLGYTAARRGHRGAAVRALWTALGLSGQTTASRLQREQLRASAYHGMAVLADRRGQEEWAALLRLCRDMASSYARSDEAQTAHATFYDDLERFKRQQKKLERQRKKAERASFWQKVGATASVLGAAAQSAASGRQQISDHKARQIATQISNIERLDEAMKEKFRQGMNKLSGAIGELRAITARDIPDIEAGREFVAQQVAWYLLTVEDPRIYLDALRAYASSHPTVSAPLEALNRATDPAAAAESAASLADDVHDLTLHILSAERYASQFERVSRRPHLVDADRACAKGEVRTGCRLIVREVCRARILAGCVALSRLLRGKEVTNVSGLPPGNTESRDEGGQG